MLNKEIVVSFYEHYLRQFKVRNNFNFIPTEREEKIIINFLNNINNAFPNNSFGEEWLQRYYEFQFIYWSDKKTRFDQYDYVPIGWCLGKKAIERWLKQSNKAIYIINKNVRKNKIKKKQNDVDLSFLINISKIEEVERKRYLNTEEGLANCIIFTTLYHPKSNYCILCNNKEECINIQKINYPIVFEKRSDI